MADIEKLDLIIKNVETFPEQHNQADWGVKTKCGTAYCVAGWTGVVDQAEMTWTADGRLALIEDVHPQDYGTASLGLTRDQADCLFHEENSVETIKQMRDAIAADPEVGWSALFQIADLNGDR